MLSINPGQATDALQDLIDELHITSLDESDIQSGLQDLNTSEVDLSSGVLPEDDTIDEEFKEGDDESSQSGISTEVRRALGAFAPDSSMGGGGIIECPAAAALEADLRLSSFPGLILPSASPAASIRMQTGLEAGAGMGSVNACHAAALESDLRLSSISGLGLPSASPAASIVMQARMQAGMRTAFGGYGGQNHVQESQQQLELSHSIAALAEEQRSQSRAIQDLRRSNEEQTAMHALKSLRPLTSDAERPATSAGMASPFAPSTAATAAAPAGAGFRLQMQDISISEAAYQSLRAKRDEELTVREWVQMRFHELRSTQRAENERLQLDVETLREELVFAQTSAEKAQRQLARREASATDLTQELEKQRQESRAQLEQVTSDLHAAQNQIAMIQDKGRRFDEVAKERSQFEAEVATLRDAMSCQSAAQLQLSKEHAESVDRLHQLETQYKLTQQDAQAHERRANMMEDTLARRDEEVTELRAKVESLREKKRELARKAELEQASTAQDVHAHVDAEIRRFQEQARADIEAVRVNLTGLHEKEVAMLRERIVIAEARSSELQRRLDDEEQAHQALQLSSTRIKAELQNDIVELTGTLKLRAFEIERAALTHEEVSNARQRLELENEQLKQQVEVLRKEYYTLEVQHREGRAFERAELASLKEQLQGYKDLEKELDAAIRSCAEGPGGALRAAIPEGADAGELLLIGTTLASAPASAQRRIQQSLLLAQELQRRTRELTLAKTSLSDAESQISRLEQELEAAAREATAAVKSEPQAYLLSSLRERDAEAIRLRRELRSCSAELERWQQQAERAQAGRLRAEADLRKLLQQRQHLDGLVSILQTEPKSSDGDRSEEGPIPARAEHRGRAPSQQPQGSAAGAGPAWLQKLRAKLKPEGSAE
eukprot:TRINITY_DN75717_c0_g1_i1.p1 TRINITY_DN75717_c0_g1~~TRINITY_DN75717_c0_g1_i1.p1  ORF type:complete len:897 (-),score=226.31 TRINITY_DN75717_c0_g1_i1:48-2738(-)